MSRQPTAGFVLFALKRQKLIAKKQCILICCVHVCTRESWVRVQSGPKSTLTNYQQIILKPARGIRFFFRQLKMSKECYNIITWY